MKHNPRLNEKMARLAGIGDIHPLQPQSTVQGAIQLMETLADYLMELTGMPAVALSPKAGAHGELCGMLAIKAAHEASGSKRDVVLVPDSAQAQPRDRAFRAYRSSRYGDGRTARVFVAVGRRSPGLAASC